MHGGLSPDLNSMEQIRRVMRPTDVSQQPLAVTPFCTGPHKVLVSTNADFLRFLIAACFVICYGPILTRTSLAGVKTTEACPSPLGRMSCRDSCKSTTWT